MYLNARQWQALNPRTKSHLAICAAEVMRVTRRAIVNVCTPDAERRNAYEPSPGEAVLDQQAGTGPQASCGAAHRFASHAHQQEGDPASVPASFPSGMLSCTTTMDQTRNSDTHLARQHAQHSRPRVHTPTAADSPALLSACKTANARLPSCLSRHRPHTANGSAEGLSILKLKAKCAQRDMS